MSIARTATGQEGAILIDANGAVVLGSGGGPPVTSVWSASDAAANGMTLSNGGLTVVYHGAANWVSLRGSISKNSGQVYVEFAYSAVGVNIGYAGVGAAAATFNIADMVGNSNYSGGFQLPNNEATSAGFTIVNYPNLAVAAVGDVIGMAIDFTAQKIWFSYNNSWQGGNPTTGTAPNFTFVLATVGPLFPAWSSHGTNSTGGGTWTLQPTAASQKYLPPPGFQAWDGGPVTPASSVWSASDAAALSFTLTNGGLTFTGGVGTYDTMRTSVAKSSGKLYVEFLINSSSGQGYEYLGLASSGFSISGPLGASNYSGGSQWTANSVSTGFTGHYGSSFQPKTNDVFGLAVDFGAGSVWIAKNGVWDNSSNPATASLPILSFVPATVGALYAAISVYPAGTYTLQPTAASQKYAPPAGFSAWDGAAPTHSPQALAYLARTVGGNEGGNGTNIATLIDGLVADGVWAKLDCLYVLAQQNSTDALLNLIGTNYTVTDISTGALTFVQYHGYSGFSGNNTWYLDTNFNASIATSPQFTQNSASFGFWSYATVAEGYPEMGNGYAQGGACLIYDDYTGGTFYARVNDNTAGGVPVPGSNGVFAGDRNSSTLVSPYWNGASQGNISSTSTTVVNRTFTLGNGMGAPNGTSETISAAFIGGSLGAAGQLALYNRLRTYMTAVGVP